MKEEETGTSEVFKKYVGTKEVNALPMPLGDFIKMSGRNPYVNDENVHSNDEPGYLVEYKDGYRSWSPKEVFEEAYKCSETFVDRLVIELDELSDKLDKLNKFFDTDTFKNLSGTERTLLQAQLGAMIAYGQILTARIAHYNGPASNRPEEPDSACGVGCCCDCGTTCEDAGSFDTCSDSCCGTNCQEQE